MKYWLAGLALLLAGVFLIDVNFYLGVAVMGAGLVGAKWFHGRAVQQASEKAAGLLK